LHFDPGGDAAGRVFLASQLRLASIKLPGLERLAVVIDNRLGYIILQQPVEIYT